MNLDRVRELADTYQIACQTGAEFHERDLQEEALAMILGASRCLAYPEDQREQLIKAALMEGSERV